MSQENVELHQRSIDAVNRRDLAALLGLMDEAVEAVPRIVAVEGGLRGHDGIRRWWDTWFEAFPDWKLEVVGMRDLGDVTIATFSAVGHGSGSELPFEDNAWLACRWRRGKCVWWQVFRAETEALEAAGLSDVEVDLQDRDLETLRELYSHWERGDFAYWEPFAEGYTWKAVDAVESGEYTGIAEVRAAWRAWLQAWDGFSIEAEEVIAGSDGRYVVVQLFRGKGKASGLESEERSAAVATMQDGLIVRMEGFWNRDAALQAAGVEGR